MGRPRKYRHEWEEVAHVHADHVKRWGAFDRYQGPVAFDASCGVAGARWEHDGATDRVSLLYTIGGDVKRGEFGVHRQPSPIGGERILFLAPCCGARCLRLALLVEGIRCGACGSVIPSTKRASRSRRAVILAGRSAAALGLSSWYALPDRRPGNMNPLRFAKLAIQHRRNVERATTLLRPRLEASDRLGENGRWATLAAVGP